MDEISHLDIVSLDADKVASKYENFDSFPALLPESLEHMIGKPAFGGHMLEWLLRLGLRAVTASTMQAITLYLLTATNGIDKKNISSSMCEPKDTSCA